MPRLLYTVCKGLKSILFLSYIMMMPCLFLFDSIFFKIFVTIRNSKECIITKAREIFFFSCDVLISCLVLQSENFGEMRERARSKNRKARQQLEEQIDTLLEAEMEAVPRPCLSKLWPIRLVIFLVMSVLNAPQNIRRRMEEKEERRRQEEEEKKRMEEEESKDYFIS